MSALYVRDKDGKLIPIPTIQGKSAYEYAQDGGYQGTEEGFAKKLAEDAHAVVYYEGAFDEEKVLAAVAEGKPVYCLYLAYFLPLVHWSEGYSFGGCYDNKIVTVKYAEGAWSVSEETVGEAGESNVVIVTESTGQAEMNNLLHSDKIVVLKRGQAGGSYKLYYYAGNNSFFCVYHGVTEVAVYENGSWNYSTVEGGAGNVFIGDENTTTAEFYEAYQNKKACFLYRPLGPSGYYMWTMYKANMYTAFFYSINDSGLVMYGTLASDGTWDYQAKEADCDVFVGDASTTLAEYIEAFESGKACFMKRAYGAGGSARFWTMVKCVTNYAQFLTIDDFGTVVYGTLKSDNTWETKTASTTSGVASVTLSDDSLADTDAMDEEQIDAFCTYATMFQGFGDCNFVTPNYDALYEALRSGGRAMICFDRSWMEDLGYRLPPKIFITAYALTPGGLLCWIGFDELPFAFTNGSYHNENSDPFA